MTIFSGIAAAARAETPSERGVAASAKGAAPAVSRRRRSSAAVMITDPPALWLLPCGALSPVYTRVRRRQAIDPLLRGAYGRAERKRHGTACAGAGIVGRERRVGQSDLADAARARRQCGGVGADAALDRGALAGTLARAGSARPR